MSWIKYWLVRAEHLMFGRAGSDLRWWKRRARRRGVRSVYSLGHSRTELDEVTNRQINLLFPILQQNLTGEEKLVLDFGCGPGRFTAALAGLVGGRAIGIDPIADLLELAPRRETVEYRLLKDGIIPLESASVDVAWICLVLMTITDTQALAKATGELRRVLRPNGLVFLVENTETSLAHPHLRYRSVQEYVSLLPWARLRPVFDYQDVGERISVMVGRAR